MDESSTTAEARERFAREALLLAGVESRFVGKILSYGFERGQPFLVLERLYGETLDAKLRRDGPVPPPTAFRWIEQLITGVRDCHDAKVIHRDIKPSNLFIHHDGFEETARLIDFGVARLRDVGVEKTDLTGSNHMIGSMAYMAPEQLRDPSKVGFQADLYAIGVVVYRTLTGRLPFVSRSLEAVARMKTNQAPPRISSAPGGLNLPQLDAFVFTALHREPASRFRNAREMLDQWRLVAHAVEDDLTDIMGGVGRVDESYAGPRPSAPTDPDADDRTLKVRYTSPSNASITAIAPPVPETVREPEPLGPEQEDMPTRLNPELRELVQRELDLHRGREPSSKG
jgi:serine/threonine-protein kinase